MLITALTLVGYSVAMSVGGGLIKKACNKSADKKIAAKIAELPEDHSQEEELAVIKKETVKSTAKFSILTAGLGVAGAVGSAAIITAFDTPNNDTPADANLISTDEEPVSVETTEDGVVATYADGTTVGTF